MNAKKVLAIAAAGILFSAAAFAQTTDINALLAQIAQLQAQIAALQGGSTGTSVSTGIPAGYQFTAPMRIGSTGVAVKYLQMFLNSNPATTVALSGVGSKGNESMYYGPATAAAVKKYQELNAAAVLAPVGLTTGTGNFGASTMAHVNAALKTPAQDDFSFQDDTTATETTGTSGSTEGTITATLWSSPADATTVKGGEEKNVLGIKIKTQGGDVTLKRFDVAFSSKTFTKYAQDVALYNGSEELYRFEGITLSDLEELSSTSYRLRFPLNLKLAKNTTSYFYVKVKAKQIVSAANINITVTTNDIRGVDGTGLNQYAPAAILETTASDGHTRTFSFATEETASIEAASYPGAQDKVFQVSESGTTYNVDLGNINLKSKTVGSKLKTLTAIIYGYTSAAAAKDPEKTANVAKLYDGTTLLGSATIAANADGTGTSTIAFTDLSVQIDKDTTKTLRIEVEVPQVQNTATTPSQGDYLYYALSALTADDDNLNAISTFSGSASTKYTHLYSYYPELALVSATITKTAGAWATASDMAEGTIKFSVKAVGADIYVNNLTTTTVGVKATSSAAHSTGNALQTTASSYDTYTAVVYSGETKTFTISTSIDPHADGYFYNYFDTFKWSTTSKQETPTYTWNTTTYRVFSDEWKTNNVYLNAA